MTAADLETELVSMDEIADFLGVSRRQPYDWLADSTSKGGVSQPKRQRLVEPDARKGGVCLWRRESIAGWLDELAEWAATCGDAGHSFGRNGRCCYCQGLRTELERA